MTRPKKVKDQKIRQLYKEGLPVKKLAGRFKVSKQTIYRSLKRSQSRVDRIKAVLLRRSYLEC